MSVIPIGAIDAMSSSSGGLCGGASAPSHQVHAHVVGANARNATKVIAHFESDTNGVVRGALIVGQGNLRLEVTSWCRMWSGGKGGHDAGVFHILGTTFDREGHEMFVQVDVRRSEGGRLRVRTRATSQHDDHSSVVIDEDHGGWQTLTGEGWLSASRLRIRQTTTVA